MDADVNKPTAASYAIETYLRIRPSKKRSEEKLDYLVKEVTAENGIERQFLSVEVPDHADPTFVHGNNEGAMTYEFDKVFDVNSTQEDLFQTIAETKVKIFTLLSFTLLYFTLLYFTLLHFTLLHFFFYFR